MEAEEVLSNSFCEASIMLIPEIEGKAKGPGLQRHWWGMFLTSLADMFHF